MSSERFPTEASMVEVNQLRSQLEKTIELNARIREESGRCRGQLAKGIHEVEGLLYDTKRSQKRGFPLRKQVQNLYRKNKEIRA